MLDAALLDYMKRQVSLGHSMQEVSQFLLQKGYGLSSIEECQRAMLQDMNRVPAKAHPKAIGHGGRLIALLLMILILAVTGVLLYHQFSDWSSKGSDLGISYKINFDRSSFQPGEEVYFTAEVTPKAMQKQKAVLGYEVAILSVVVKDSAMNTVYSESSRLIMKENATKRIAFRLPRYAPGIYSVESTAALGKSEANSSAVFVITENASSSASKTESCYDKVKNQGEDGIDCGGPCKPCIRQCPVFIDDHNPCTRDLCSRETNYEAVHEPITPCCGNGLCEGDEKAGCAIDCQSETSAGGTKRGDTGATASVIQYPATDESITEEIAKIIELGKTDEKSAAEMCSAIELVSYKDDCLYSLASQHGDEGFCEAMAIERDKDRCFAMLSVQREEPLLCDNIRSDLRRDSCLMRFAIKGDYTVCSRMQDSYYVETCQELSQVGTQSPDAARVS